MWIKERKKNRFGIGQKKSKAFQKCSKCNYFSFFICFHWGKQVFDQLEYTQQHILKAMHQHKIKRAHEKNKKKNTHIHYISSFSIFEALLLKLVLEHAKTTKILPIPYSNIDRQTWHIASNKKKNGENRKEKTEKTLYTNKFQSTKMVQEKKNRVLSIYILATWSIRNRDTCKIPLSCWWIFFSWEILRLILSLSLTHFLSATHCDLDAIR